MNNSDDTIQEGINRAPQELVCDEPPVEQHTDESIRTWYDRRTGKMIRSLIAATLVVILIAVLVWVAAPDWLILKLQIFNGAITIPAAGGIWLVSFTLVWLLPMREVSFRSFEAMENTRLQIRNDLNQIKTTAQEEIQEAKTELFRKVDAKLQPWVELGERLNAKFGPDFLEKLEGALETAADISRPVPPPPRFPKASAVAAPNGDPKKEEATK